MGLGSVEQDFFGIGDRRLQMNVGTPQYCRERESRWKEIVWLLPREVGFERLK